jgi:hypothetical protein
MLPYSDLSGYQVALPLCPVVAAQTEVVAEKTIGKPWRG